MVSKCIRATSYSSFIANTRYSSFNASLFNLSVSTSLDRISSINNLLFSKSVTILLSYFSIRLSLSSYNSTEFNSFNLSLAKNVNISCSGLMLYSLPRLKLYIFLSMPTPLRVIALIIFSSFSGIKPF